MPVHESDKNNRVSAQITLMTYES